MQKCQGVNRWFPFPQIRSLEPRQEDVAPEACG